MAINQLTHAIMEIASRPSLTEDSLMYILGLSAFSENASATLLKDGEVRCSIEEERLNRVKHSSGFPLLAIQECLRFENIGIGEVKLFAFFNRPDLELWGGLRHGFRYLPRSLALLLGTHGGERGKGHSFAGRVRAFYSLPGVLQSELGISRKPRVHYVEHHRAHAASAFYPSPFGKAAVVTWDGRGDIACTAGWIGEGNRLSKVGQVGIPHSIGHFYNAITGYLGFKAFEDEWKVMGMSAYGENTLVEAFQDTYHLLPDGTYRLDLSHFSHQYYGRRQLLSRKFLEKFGPPRKKDEPLTQRHFDIARGAQAASEAMGLHFARHIREATGCDKVCLTGGVSQNILLNSRVAEQAGFEEVFVQPVATDAGAAMGSALEVAHGILGLERAAPMKDLYLGPSYSESEIESALQRLGSRYSKPSDICRTVAEALNSGKIVGWFQGRMEAGPRALGNRSLLSNPCRAEYRDRLNARVKRREGFRPFAPAVLEERSDEFFVGVTPQPSRFMAASARVLPNARELIPAVTHVDGSARPQLVSRATNPLFWRVIDEFGRLSGVPVVLNTSFNEREPIVCSPEDALKTFARTEIDCLAIGPFFLAKHDA